MYTHGEKENKISTCTTIISSYKKEDGVITSCLFQSFRLLYAGGECYAEGIVLTSNSANQMSSC